MRFFQPASLKIHAKQAPHACPFFTVLLDFLRNHVWAFRTRFSRAACGTPLRQLAAAAPGHGRQPGGGPWERHAAWRLVLRAFRATAPAVIQALLRNEVQTLPPVTRQQLLQLWQATLQLVQGGSGPRQPAVQACDAGAEHYETTTYY